MQRPSLIRRALFSISFIFFTATAGFAQQPYVMGTSCIQLNTEYHYFVGGVSDYQANFTWSVSGGTITESYTTYANGDGLSSIHVTFTSLGGAIWVQSYEGSSPQYSVNVLTTLSPGSIYSNAYQNISYNTTPSTIYAAGATEGCPGTHSYQWQQSPNNSNWTDMSGKTSENLTFSSGLTQTMYYRRKVTGANSGSDGYTGSATVDVNPPLTAITGNGLSPTVQDVFVGDYISNIGGGPAYGGDCNSNYDYQWQFSSDNNTFSDLTEANSLSYALGVAYSPATSYYRRKVTCSSQSVYTASVRVSVYPHLTSGSISTSSSNISYNTSPGQISATAATVGMCSSPSYQWESSTDGGSWTAISGATGQNYTPGNLLANTAFRRKVSCGPETLYTPTSVTFTIPPLTSGSITTQGGSISYNTSPGQITATGATGGRCGGPSYQWESSIDGGSWTAIGGATGPNYTPVITADTQFRRKASCASETVYTNSISFTIPPLTSSSITTQGGSILYNTSPGQITASAATQGRCSSPSYQWESSTDGGTWTAIGGSTGQNYTPGNLLANTAFRRKVSCGSETLYTNSISFTIPPLTSGSITTQGVTILYNTSPGQITASAATQGRCSSPAYQWQSSPDGNSWSDVGGATGQNYTLGNLLATTRFRRKVSCGSEILFTNSIIMTIYYPLSGGVLSVAQTTILPRESPGMLSASAVSGGNCSSNYTYTWKKSTDGTNFSTIPEITGLTYTSPILQVTTHFRMIVTCESLTESSDITITVLPDYNYVREYTMQIPGISENSIAGLSKEQKSMATNFIDGLGRPLQTVSWQASPQGKDIIQPVVYDELGREAVKYLPFVPGQDKGWAKESPTGTTTYTGSAHQQFYANGSTDKIVDDTKPYDTTIFENSPLNRVAKQYGAGAAWYTAQKYLQHSYLVNKNGTGIGQERVIAWAISGNALSRSGYYPDGELTIKSTRDEQGNEMREYTDKEGHIILKKVQAVSSPTLSNNDHWAHTYYIYDDFGNLRFVLQPELSKIIHANDSNNPAQAQLDELGFQYRYDASKRMSEKKVPSAGWVYMVYDNRDRLILTQDANQRAGATNAIKYWTFTKYDELNRPILTGIKDTTTSTELTQSQMQTVVNNYYANMNTTTWRKWGESYVGSAIGNMHGYSNRSYPIATTAATKDANRYLTVTYYDDYAFKTAMYDSASYSFKANELPGEQASNYFKKLKNQVTGAKVKVLDGGVAGGYTWLKTVNYYDDKYRMIQVVADNYKGGTDRVTNVVDFSGKVLKSLSTKTEMDLTWKDGIGVSIEGNKLIRVAAGSSWAASGAASVQQLSASQNGWIEFVTSETNLYRMVGLSDVNTDANYTTLDYAWFPTNNGTLQIYESGASRGSFGNYLPGDVLKIERTGTTIKYYQNNTLKYTSAVASSTLLMADVSLYDNLTTAVNIRSSFSTITKTITRRFNYDHAGRLTKTWYKLDNQPEILLSANEYNELGQLVAKKVHAVAEPLAGQQQVTYSDNTITASQYNGEKALVAGTSVTLSPGFIVPAGKTFTARTANTWNGSNNNPSHGAFQQVIDYRYNIRGWLTKMNESDLAPVSGDRKDFFGMQLAYNDDLGTGNSSALQYNGNISAIRWSSNLAIGEVKQNAYNYTYDAMNRILGAGFKEKSASWNTPANSAFSESGYSYDLNGNILKLSRRSTGSNLMDSLTYTYATNSNKLVKVLDNGDDFKGFADGANVATEYTYDANGSMITDLNKGISSNIVYNYLNLPELVTRGTGNTIRYIYDATGRKLSQVATYTYAQKQVDYAGEFQYENDQLQTVSHEEGRILFSNEKSLVANTGGSSGITAYNVSLSVPTINGNTYVKALSTGTVVRTGMYPIGGTLTVQAGERYKVRFRGYRDKGNAASSNPAYILIQANGVDLEWGASIANSPETESWIERIVTIPAGASQLQAGVVWANVLNGEAIYLNDFEIIKIETATPEYQYTLKDHLGNARLTFTTKRDKEDFTATYETGSSSTEQASFNPSYDQAVIVNAALYNHTPAGSKSERLSAANENEIIGLAKSFKVMPGDTIDAEVFAKYVTPTNTDTNVSGLILAAMSGAFGVSAVSTGEAGLLYQTLSAMGGAGLLVQSGENVDNNSPKAYLNYILFDDKFIPYDFGFDQISSAGLSAHEYLHVQAKVAKAGYAYIYLSNENNKVVDVYFDDVKITHTKSPVIQTDDYYPGGATFNSYQRENSVVNDIKFQETEWQDELGLNLYDFDARLYDPYTIRTTTLDPHGESYPMISSYSFLNNNPINFLDPTGMDASNLTDELTICPTCDANNPDHQKYIDDPNNTYYYDEASGNVSQLLEEVTVTDEKPSESTLAFASLVASATSNAVKVGTGIANVATLTFGLVLMPSTAINDSEMDHLERMRAKYIPAPKTLPGFPGAQRVKSKNQRARWRDSNGDILEWDSERGEVEVYDKRGKNHKGAANPETGKYREGSQDKNRTTDN